MAEAKNIKAVSTPDASTKGALSIDRVADMKPVAQAPAAEPQAKK